MTRAITLSLFLLIGSGCKKEAAETKKETETPPEAKMADAQAKAEPPKTVPPKAGPLTDEQCQEVV